MTEIINKILPVCQADMLYKFADKVNYFHADFAVFGPEGQVIVDSPRDSSDFDFDREELAGRREAAEDVGHAFLRRGAMHTASNIVYSDRVSSPAIHVLPIKERDNI